MQGLLELEELVVSDSFRNYCFKSNEVDIHLWEEYLILYPSEKEKIEEARKIVMGLHIMLRQGAQHKKEEKNKEVKAKYFSLFSNSPINKILLSIASIAAIFVFLFFLNKTFNNSFHEKKVLNPITAKVEATGNLIYSTGYGEKKIIKLPDNSIFHLNSGSTLTVDKGYGKSNRNVYLKGEALFDVSHNASLPFIVHTGNYEVKVLGTLFNVKNYPGDKVSETSLLRGRVEITMKDGAQNEKIVLVPNQKAVIDNIMDSLVVKGNRSNMLYKSVSLHPLSHNGTDNTVIETAWAQNKLEIINESFGEMKDKLERWYDVNINFKDTVVTKYTFSAIFEKENIQEALEALQEAYHFNYSINGNEVIISK
ncbi:MAG TPA: FecR family protein [Arachidicoccus soli]|nr:FecR family protein [Arachidicoccus soli]